MRKTALIVGTWRPRLGLWSLILVAGLVTGCVPAVLVLAVLPQTAFAAWSVPEPIPAPPAALPGTGVAGLGRLTTESGEAGAVRVRLARAGQPDLAWELPQSKGATLLAIDGNATGQIAAAYADVSSSGGDKPQTSIGDPKVTTWAVDSQPVAPQLLRVASRGEPEKTRIAVTADGGVSLAWQRTDGPFFAEPRGLVAGTGRVGGRITARLITEDPAEILDLDEGRDHATLTYAHTRRASRHTRLREVRLSAAGVAGPRTKAVLGRVESDSLQLRTNRRGDRALIWTRSSRPHETTHLRTARAGHRFAPVQRFATGGWQEWELALGDSGDVAFAYLIEPRSGKWVGVARGPAGGRLPRRQSLTPAAYDTSSGLTLEVTRTGRTLLAWTIQAGRSARCPSCGDPLAAVATTATRNGRFEPTARLTSGSPTCTPHGWNTGAGLALIIGCEDQADEFTTNYFVTRYRGSVRKAP